MLPGSFETRNWFGYKDEPFEKSNPLETPGMTGINEGGGRAELTLWPDEPNIGEKTWLNAWFVGSLNVAFAVGMHIRLGSKKGVMGGLTTVGVVAAFALFMNWFAGDWKVCGIVVLEYWFITEDVFVLDDIGIPNGEEYCMVEEGT